MRVFMVLSEISVNNGGIVVRGETVLFLVAQNPGMVGIPAPAFEQPVRIGCGDERTAFVRTIYERVPRSERHVFDHTQRIGRGDGAFPVAAVEPFGVDPSRWA